MTPKVNPVEYTAVFFAPGIAWDVLCCVISTRKIVRGDGPSGFPALGWIVQFCLCFGVPLPVRISLLLSVVVRVVALLLYTVVSVLVSMVAPKYIGRILRDWRFREE